MLKKQILEQLFEKRNYYIIYQKFLKENMELNKEDMKK